MKKVKNLLRSQVFRGSFVVLVGTTIANLLNYLYHLFTGRLLGPEQYGLLSGLIGSTYFFGVLSGTFSISIINLTSNQKKALIPSTIHFLEKKAIKISFFLWLLLLTLFPLFKKIFHFQEFSIFLIYTLQLLLIFVPTIYLAVLQAKLKFLYFSIIVVVITILKLLSTLIFIKTGFKIQGALAGLIIAGMGAIILGKIFTGKFWPRKKIPKNNLKLDRKFWSYSLLVLFTGLFLTSLISTDLILARYYLPAIDSGLYSATTNLGKIIYFTAFSALTVAFPLFVKHKNNPQKLKKVFHLGLLLLAVICFTGTLSYRLFPQLIPVLLYGPQYKNTAPFMFPIAINFSLYAFFHLSIQILLALGKPLSAYLTGMAALGQIILLSLRHQNPAVFIQNTLFILIFACFIGLVSVAKIIYAPQKK